MKYHRCLILVLLMALAARGRAQLLISEYIDASTTRCGIELWNVSGTNITFGSGPGQMDVRLEIYANGSVTPTVTLALTPGATVQAGFVFVVAHSLATFAQIANQTASAVSWTGDDAIVVRLGAGPVLDSLGQVGVDPGTEWGTGSASTADNTLRRKEGNIVADTDPFNAYEPAAYFDGYPVDNAENLGLPPSAGVLPYVATVPPTGVSGDQATFRGEVNSSNTTTTIWFQYGNSTNYGSTTPAQMAGSGIHGFVYTVTGLVAGVVYHYRAVASNSLGSVFGTNQSFMILSPPAVVTLPASAVGGATGTLNGQVNPQGLPTMAWFEWNPVGGPTNLTVPQSLGSGSANTSFSNVISALSAGETYFFRAFASNSAGVASGARLSFTTASPFTLVTNLTGVYRGSSAWGDYDGDGRLDIMLAGSTNDVATTRMDYGAELWRNTGNGFSKIINAWTNFIEPASALWADVDGDGDLDMTFHVITYYYENLTGFPKTRWEFLTYQNTNQFFVRMTNVPPEVGLSDGFIIPPRRQRAWMDYDNDGRLDFASGSIWRNSGATFTQVPSPNFAGREAVAWGDYDNDGRADVAALPFNAAVWRNTGTAFTNTDALPRVADGSAAWGDFDNDGRIDLLLAGKSNSVESLPITEVWRNTGAGFARMNFGLPGIWNGNAAWGDFDSDGLLDIFLTGQTNTNTVNVLGTAELWRNTGTGFSRVLILTRVAHSSVAWGDYDNDGRLDLLLTGTTNDNVTGAISQIWRNNSPQANTPPAVPAGLSASISNTVLTLTWNASTDAQTPSVTLTYNLRVGTAPGRSDLVAPMVRSDGQLLIPQAGNRHRARTWSWQMTNFVGQAIYWSVQAVDSSFAGSAFAPEASLRMLPVIVPANVTYVENVTPGDVDGDGIVSQSELDAVLANYWPNSPWLFMTNVAGLETSNITFAISNSTAGAFSVEFSTNLVNWYFLGPATPRYEFQDTNAPGQPQRYYRLRWP